MGILVITTGGTIGAMAYPNPDKPPAYVPMPEKGIDFVAMALKEQFGFAPTRCVTIEPRDSKNIDQAYLQSLLHLMVEAPEDKIILTHGTDRLLHSAGFFYEQASDEHPLSKKTLILTGAMVPLANGSDSDGYRNLEFSLRVLDDDKLGAGVHIVLCDYADQLNEIGEWTPHIFAYEPETYEKVFGSDARYNRLRRV